jgi:hypothetical protein
MFISQEMLGNALDALAATVTHAPAEDGRYSAGWVTGFLAALAAVAVVIGKEVKTKPAVFVSRNDSFVNQVKNN